MKEYDLIVIGLGIMGVSTIYHASRSGAAVLGIEAFGPVHKFGSSHGETRIFRRAYWEGEKYLPLLNRAHELWMALEAVAGEKLTVPTGGLFIGLSSTGIVQGSKHTAESGLIAHEVFDSSGIRKHFPAFRPPENMEAIYEPGAYVVLSERARLHMLSSAIDSGAEAQFGKKVETIEDDHQHGLVITTDHGESIAARSVVVTTGPWTGSSILPELNKYLSPNQVPVYWFDVRKGYEKEFTSGSFPAFLYEHGDHSLLYGIPTGISPERGVKIGFHNRQHISANPDNHHRVVSGKHIAEISAYVSEVLPGLMPQPISSRSCFYTMSPDESFLIGASQKSPNIFFASACSGHGFKFGPAIGECLSLLAQGKQPLVDLSVFNVSRFL